METMKHPIEKCPNCGAPVYFFDPLWNQCDDCKFWFNGSGQEVMSPDAYEDDPENTESLADIYSDRDPEDVGYSDGIW